MFVNEIQTVVYYENNIFSNVIPIYPNNIREYMEHTSVGSEGSIPGRS
jgi:hypothetical protein